MDTTAPVPRLRKSRAKATKRITPQQQLYADFRAQGLTQGEAALRAGYANKTSAYKADKNPAVREHISAIQRLAQVKTAYTVEMSMQEAFDTMEFAREKGNPMAYCKAVELRAKLSGLLIERVEVFTADLRSALLAASKRVVEVSPGCYDVLTPEHVADTGSNEAGSTHDASANGLR